ncbi:hypothetical protein GCM10027082_08190 [Comamonas humi]
MLERSVWCRDAQAQRAVQYNRNYHTIGIFAAEQILVCHFQTCEDEQVSLEVWFDWADVASTVAQLGRTGADHANGGGADIARWWKHAGTEVVNTWWRNDAAILDGMRGARLQCCEQQARSAWPQACR